MEDIKKRFESKGIVISRIPEWAKEEFKFRAEEEFADDYGMLLAALLKDSFEYNKLKEMMFNNALDIKLVVGNKEQPTEEESKEPKSISGEPIKRMGGKQ